MTINAAARVLADALDRAEGARIRVGAVTVASPLTLTLGGSSTAVQATGKNSAYTPTISDVVLCLQQGPVVFVVCKIG